MSTCHCPGVPVVSNNLDSAFHQRPNILVHLEHERYLKYLYIYNIYIYFYYSPVNSIICQSRASFQQLHSLDHAARGGE